MVGATAAQAKAKLGAARVDHLEGGLKRLVFAKARTEVYFKEGGTKALGVVTWNKAYRTAAGLGPCSRVADLKAAYARKLKPIRLRRRRRRLPARQPDVHRRGEDRRRRDALRRWPPPLRRAQRDGVPLAFADSVPRGPFV